MHSLSNVLYIIYKLESERQDLNLRTQQPHCEWIAGISPQIISLYYAIF